MPVCYLFIVRFLLQEVKLLLFFNQIIQSSEAVSFRLNYIHKHKTDLSCCESVPTLTKKTDQLGVTLLLVCLFLFEDLFKVCDTLTTGLIQSLCNLHLFTHI